MLISEFITKLEEYKEQRGDLEMLFSVGDYFSKGGFDAYHSHMGNGHDNFWDGTISNGDQVRFQVHLKGTNYQGEERKEAKVTFRKTRAGW